MINIYSKLLEEAKRSPLLLSDLAGLEEYIAESYNNRSFIELLQNADDAGSSAFLITSTAFLKNSSDILSCSSYPCVFTGFFESAL